MNDNETLYGAPGDEQPANDDFLDGAQAFEQLADDTVPDSVDDPSKGWSFSHCVVSMHDDQSNGVSFVSWHRKTHLSQETDSELGKSLHT